jgi:hypothetical protein
MSSQTLIQPDIDAFDALPQSDGWCNERTKRPNPEAGSRSRNRRSHTAHDRAFQLEGVEAGHRPGKPRPSRLSPSPNRTESGRIRQ